MLRRYERIADLMQLTKDITELAISRGIDPMEIKEYQDENKREIRRILKRIDREFVDPLAKSMREGWRSMIEDIGEYGKDYRILPVENMDGWTDDRIDDYIMSEVGYPPICLPYDCTGKRFTSYTKFSRMPAGIVMVHAWGLDV